MGFLIEEKYGFLGLKTRTVYVNEKGIFLVDSNLNETDTSES
jgi:hypothetical protein